jgi:hypothetical protein
MDEIATFAGVIRPTHPSFSVPAIENYGSRSEVAGDLPWGCPTDAKTGDRQSIPARYHLKV